MLPKISPQQTATTLKNKVRGHVFPSKSPSRAPPPKLKPLVLVDKLCHVQDQPTLKKRRSAGTRLLRLLGFKKKTKSDVSTDYVVIDAPSPARNPANVRRPFVVPRRVDFSEQQPVLVRRMAPHASTVRGSSTVIPTPSGLCRTALLPPTMRRSAALGHRPRRTTIRAQDATPIRTGSLAVGPRTAAVPGKTAPMVHVAASAACSTSTSAPGLRPLRLPSIMLARPSVDTTQVPPKSTNAARSSRIPVYVGHSGIALRHGGADGPCPL